VPEPPPEAELALLLAGTRGRRDRARARIAELAEQIDEDAFVAFLADQRMLLLGATRLAELVPRALSERFHARLAGGLDDGHSGAMVFAAATRHLTDALEHEGIPAIELKGAGLAADLYGDGALRAYADIDVLVPVDALDHAVAIASRFGWREPAEATDSGPPTLHRWLDHPEGVLPVLELHWRIHWYETRFAPAMLARSHVIEGVRRLEPVDQFAALLLFYARDGFAGLRLAADIGAWWDRHGSGQVADRFESLVIEYPELAETWRAALAAASPLVGLPASALTAALSPRTRRAVLARRLRNWDLRGDTDQIKANVTLVDGLLTPADALGAFTHRHVLVPSTYLTEAYGVAPDASWRASWWRAWHVARTAARYGLALWALRRGRSWSALPRSVRQGVSR
jgi:hypothetical protein